VDALIGDALVDGADGLSIAALFVSDTAVRGGGVLALLIGSTGDRQARIDGGAAIGVGQATALHGGPFMDTQVVDTPVYGAHGERVDTVAVHQATALPKSQDAVPVLAVGNLTVDFFLLCAVAVLDAAVRAFRVPADVVHTQVERAWLLIVALSIVGAAADFVLWNGASSVDSTPVCCAGVAVIAVGIGDTTPIQVPVEALSDFTLLCCAGMAVVTIAVFLAALQDGDICAPPLVAEGFSTGFVGFGTV